jgi:predicted SnoaL-like aldol condensation-catalyzing enzyme
MFPEDNKDLEVVDKKFLEIKKMSTRKIISDLYDLGFEMIEQKKFVENLVDYKEQHSLGIESGTDSFLLPKQAVKMMNNEYSLTRQKFER